MGNATLSHRTPLTVAMAQQGAPPPSVPMPQPCAAPLPHRDPLALAMLNVATPHLAHRDPISAGCGMSQMSQMVAGGLSHREPMGIPQPMQFLGRGLAHRDPLAPADVAEPVQQLQRAERSLAHREPLAPADIAEPVQQEQRAARSLSHREWRSIGGSAQQQQQQREAQLDGTEWAQNLVQEPIVQLSTAAERQQYYCEQQAILAQLREGAGLLGGDEGAEPADRERYYDEQAAILASLAQVTVRTALELPAVDAAPQQPAAARPEKRQRRQRQGERYVRVFISSTFRDMGEEREVLLKRTMPALRAAAARRGVALSEVDLRWGVSEEQTRSGATIAICLGEVDRCRPWFLCMLGERYGWSQGDRQDELLAKTFAQAEPQYPWITKYADRSVTELEVRAGVLNDQKANEHALFLLRDPSYSEGRGADYAPESQSSHARLQRLKSEVRQCGSPVAEYRSPGAVDELVRSHFAALLEREFPEQEPPTPLERERASHEAFARSRSRVYVGGEQYMHALDCHLASQLARQRPQPVVIVGDSGSGKSALLCNYVCRLEAAQPDAFVLAHYIGSTAASADLGNTLHRLVSEIADYYGLSAAAVPTELARLVEAFPGYLHEASTRGGMILVLDALNQLDPKDNAQELLWLPEQMPAGVRLVCSVLPSRASDVLAARGWKTLRVEAMEESARRQLVQRSTEQYGKTLSQQQVARLVTAEQTRNPLFLRTVLEELRVSGSFETLSERIEQCLRCRTVPELLRLVLARVEGEMREQAQAAGAAAAGNCVGALLGLLVVARRGVREDEAAAMLRLPPVAWATVYMQLSELLISRAGLLNFSHDYVRQAASAMYVEAGGSGASAYRSMLIEHFEEQLAAVDGAHGPSERLCEELPYALEQEQRAEELAALVSNPHVFLALCEPAHRFDLFRYWRVCSGRGHPAEHALVAHLLDTHVAQHAALLEAGKFLEEMAAYESAETVYEAALEAAASGGELAVAEVRDALGYLYRLQGRFEEATPHYEAALEARQRRCGEESAATAATMCSLAVLFRKRGMYDRAEPLYLKSCQLLGMNHPDTGQSHNGLGCLYQDQNRDKLSEKHFRIALQIRERCYGPNHPEVAMTLTNLATLLLTQARYDESEALCKRALEIYQDVYGDNHPDVAHALSYLASVYVEKGKYATAEPLYVRAIAIKKKLLGGKHPEVADSLSDYGVFYARQQQYDKALELYQQCLAIRTEVLGEMHPDTAQAMNNVAAVLMDRGEHDRAEQMYKRALEVTELKFGRDHTNVCQSLLKLANLYQRQHRSADTIAPLYERTLAILRASYGEIHPDVALTLNDYAVLLFSQGRLDASEAMYLRMVGVLEKLFKGDHPELARAYENIASFYEATGKEADELDFKRKAREMRARL
eukprot:m51a1_g10070 hypothetical protein (1394) ;mRNA; f:13934-19564